MDTAHTSSQSLSLLEQVQAFTTLDALRMVSMNCPQRISELRKSGHPIDTLTTWRADDHGNMHHVGLYVWNPQLIRQKNYENSKHDV